MSHATDIIKLAPTLSAEERFKMVVTDMQKELEGGQRTLSETERQAIMRCEGREMWEDYTRRIGIIQWADVFWTKDIEMEKLRVFACSLLLERELDRFFLDNYTMMPPKMREMFWASIKEYVEMMERCLRKFYAYREAIAVVERELYGMPLFHRKKSAIFASYYEAMDDTFERYNYRIKKFYERCQQDDIPKTVMENVESYVVKKPIPAKELVDELVDEVMGVVDSEMEMLGR
jgi:hypothetical protein